MKEKQVITAMQLGRIFAPKPEAQISLKVTVYDADNTRHEASVRVDSEDLARMGDVLLNAYAPASQPVSQDG